MRTVLGRWQTWAGFGIAAVVLFGVAPVVLSDFRLSLLGKFLCFAIVAVGIRLAWGGAECWCSAKASSSASAAT